jgi:hypothetical protein
VVGALCAGFLLGQTTTNFDKWWTPEDDALASAPQNHKLLFENDEVRVIEVTVPPGVREPLHAHRYPSVLYYISSAHMKEYSPGIAAVEHPRKEDGGVVFLPIGPPASNGEHGDQQASESHTGRTEKSPLSRTDLSSHAEFCRRAAMSRLAPRRTLAAWDCPHEDDE